MLVDDSIVVRRFVAEAIEQSGDCQLCCSAKTGREALSQFHLTRPDVVVLDLRMPEMDGIETIHAIRASDDRTPILMFSAEDGAEATTQAVRAGATDCLTKPTGLKDRRAVLRWLASDLLPRIRAFARNAYSPASCSFRRSQQAHRSKRAAAVVAVGASTGGPEALASILSALPDDFEVPILVAQHMPGSFTPLLAERLTRAGSLPVFEATDGVVPQPGQVYLAPGGLHLAVEKADSNIQLRLDKRPKLPCRPSVDILFRSVAEIYGANSLAVVLTGMGRDCVLGAQAISDAKGKIIVQDAASSVVWGMPRAVAARSKPGKHCSSIELDRV